jgi:feruloyl-CoA synthase
VLDTPPSLDLGEITDKGSINQRAVLAHRAAVVDAMYRPDAADAGVIVASAPRRA